MAVGRFGKCVNFTFQTKEKKPRFYIHFQFIISSLRLLKWSDSSDSLNEPHPIKSIVN